jgi:hypothetical protein
MALRKQIQTSNGIGITAAQDLCAAMLHTSRRAWQQWERGERNIHPAFWELISIKSGRTGGNAGMATADEPRRRQAGHHAHKRKHSERRAHPTTKNPKLA